MLPSADDHGMSAPSAAAEPGGVGHGEGSVRKIDRAAGKITVRHGPLVGLKGADGRDMPGMTMVFRVKEPAELDRLKVGDKVRFTVVREDGALVVPSIEPAR
jgi:Cu/Ag efflux protein CusF